MTNDPKILIKELEEKGLKIVALEDKNIALEEEVRLLKKALFGPKTERFIDSVDQPELGLDISPVDEKKAETEQIEYERKKKRKGLKLERFSYPDDLAVEEVNVGELKPVRICEKTGEQMILMRTEKSDKLAIRPSQYYIR